MKKFFGIKEIIITVMIFVFMWGLSFIPMNTGFLSPVANALSDFDVYDIVYARLMEDPPVDTNIVLVNLGNLTRGELAAQIKILNKFRPKVIGIDAFFEAEKDAPTDSALSLALSEYGNVVLVSKLTGYNEEKSYYDSIGYSIKRFSRHTMDGFANLPDDEKGGFRTIRDFRPFEHVKDSIVPAFSSKIAGIYSREALSLLQKRGSAVEKINYKGNYNKFYFIDAAQSLDPEADFSFLKNKIVLIGYMGPDFNTKTLEDIFFTPKNERYAGKSFPDMYGIVIHANIISMILSGHYINTMPEWLSILLAVIIGFINVKMLLFIKARYHLWASGLTKLVIFLYSIFNLFISLEVLYYLNYRINLTLALVAVVLSTTVIEFYENWISKIPQKIIKKRK
jgi:CHASE2 domain-containing sensor protein